MHVFLAFFYVCPICLVMVVMVSDTSTTSSVCSQPTSKQQWPGAMATEQANITEVCKCSSNSQVHSDHIQGTDESLMSVRNSYVSSHTHK